jgi:eukaryotic translation initiation factor 2C
MDSQCARHIAVCKSQHSKTEYIQQLDSMVLQQLHNFVKKCKVKPMSILFYRDGVSELQQVDVYNREMELIIKACNDMDPNYRPLITYIFVQKRHHAKLFPVDSADSDKFGNVLPGTVVDSGITNPYCNIKLKY